MFKRYTEKTLGLLEVLRQRGVRIILVTSPPTDEVARFATILLPCRVDANGIKNSSLAPVCLADYLCNTVAMADPEAAMKRMKESEQLFRQSEILRD